MALTSQPLRNRPPFFRTPRRPDARANAGSANALPEPYFIKALSLERKRSERSGKPFLLVLVDMSRALEGPDVGRFADTAMGVLDASVRETDLMGWYESGLVIGLIFTELGEASRQEVQTALGQRVSDLLLRALGEEDSAKTSLSFHFFPDEQDGQSKVVDLKLYPDYSRPDGRRVAQAAKRAMDIVGSACAIVLLAPVLLLIALLIKLTSKGPVLFRQSRLGYYGRPFTFLKFRSMYVGNDATIHREYVARLIAGKIEDSGDGNGSGVFKITDDPRITSLGRLLRKTSLDELPQFFNVLKGEMSLIGPRPPVPYEFEQYDLWHRRRVLETKPGITGLWQVRGRSRTSFDEMVRLDLEYVRSWSLWLDLKILLLTPGAVFSGDGAY
jgi:lipopolysaccharide/colanic/teichoic acid biosynthesis glycosyltransferase